MPSMTEVKCKQCKKPFMARTADVKRGWGKFCSKRCKARKQERHTGQYKAYLNSQKRLWKDDPVRAYNNEIHPFSSEGLGQD